MSNMKRVQIFFYKKNPPNTKRVARPTRWKNPYKLREHGGIYTRAGSLRLYAKHLDKMLNNDEDFLLPLVGYDLGCFCPLNLDCHADILLSKIRELYNNK